MKTWIEDGIVALEAMKGEIDTTLGTLRKLQGGQPQEPAPLPPPLGARPPRQKRQKRQLRKVKLRLTLKNRVPHSTAAQVSEPVSTKTQVVSVPGSTLRVSRATTPADVVAERDAAILAHLQQGEATRGFLLQIIPVVPGQTDEQRTASCGNAIMRLKAKGKIRQTETGWKLA